MRPFTPPQQGTKSAREYVTAQRADLHLLAFVTSIAMSQDYVQHVARRALEGAELDRASTPESLARSAPGRHTQALRDKRQALLEMLLARTVDNYLRYVVDIIREVLAKHPNLLRSREQAVSVEEILDHSRREDLIHFLIESKVNSLSYSGFERIRDWCEARGIPLITASEADYRKMVEFISTRNLIAHSRCRVDEKYLRTVGSSSRAIGDIRDISVDDYFDCVGALAECVSLTDVAAAAKFGLDVLQIPPPDSPKSAEPPQASS
jgi:hypothetical protein